MRSGLEGYRVVQCAEMGTGSTLLTNILHGLFDPESPVCFCCNAVALRKRLRDNFIVKTHSEEVSSLWGLARFEVYMVCSLRRDRGKVRFLEVGRDIPNMIFVDYELLNVGVEEGVDNVVRLLAGVPFVGLASREGAIRRVESMNRRYEEIKHEPFSFVDKFFHIHGSHRGRGLAT